MDITLTITYDSYHVLRYVLDVCRTQYMKQCYDVLLDLTMKLESQASHSERVADVVTLVVSDAEYVMLWECIYRVEGIDERIAILQEELSWSCQLADALIGKPQGILGENTKFA